MSAIQSICINNLQRLKNITVDFERTGVTAIMGANGSGKTTLLQALACVYQRDSSIDIEHKTYAYSDFFKPYDGNNWQESSFQVSFIDKNNKKDSVTYLRDDDSWTPRTQNKKNRYVKYISMLDCIPHQEKEIEEIINTYEKKDIDLKPAKRTTLLQKVSGALHKDYVDIGNCEKTVGLGNFFYARTRNRTNEELEYPSHYMGAGEQKIIFIINEVLKAPKGALILIEELDVSLHESAIRSLINVLVEQALDNKRQLQIVFTTHWLGIQDFTKKINVVSLLEDTDTQKIEVRNGFDPQFIYKLNGDYQALRQIKIWVEDGLAVKIVEQVALDLGYREFVEIKSFGSVQNAYTLAGAAAVTAEKLDRTIIVTDGDCYLSQEKKQLQIQNKIDGNGDIVKGWHQQSLGLIIDLNAPNQSQPEEVLLDLCRNYVDQGSAPPWLKSDLVWIAQQIPLENGKQAIYNLSTHRNMTIDRVEGMIIQEASRTSGWNSYVEPLITRLHQAAENIGLPRRDEVTA